MPLQLLFPGGTPQTDLDKIFGFCDKFGSAEITFGATKANIIYKDSRDEEDALEWFASEHPEIKISKVSTPSEMEKQKISEPGGYVLYAPARFISVFAGPEVHTYSIGMDNPGNFKVILTRPGIKAPLFWGSYEDCKTGLHSIAKSLGDVYKIITIGE